MRTIFGSILVVLCIAAPRAPAGDVAYQLETSALVPDEETRESQSLILTIKDREWAMPGVEEASECFFDDRTGVRRTSSRHAQSNHLQLDKVFWPLTRQIFGDGDVMKDVFSICIVASP